MHIIRYPIRIAISLPRYITIHPHQARYHRWRHEYEAYYLPHLLSLIFYAEEHMGLIESYERFFDLIAEALYPAL